MFNSVFSLEFFPFGITCSSNENIANYFIYTKDHQTNKADYLTSGSVCIVEPFTDALENRDYLMKRAVGASLKELKNIINKVIIESKAYRTLIDMVMTLDPTVRKKVFLTLPSFNPTPFNIVVTNTEWSISFGSDKHLFLKNSFTFSKSRNDDYIKNCMISVCYSLENKCDSIIEKINNYDIMATEQSPG